MTWIDKKDILYDYIVNKKRSYVDIGREFGVSGSYIKKVAKRFGIPITARRKINPNETFGAGTAKKGICKYCGKEFVIYLSTSAKYCCTECSAKGRKKETIDKWKSGEHNGTKAFTCASFVRDYMFEKANYKCEKCGWGEENPYTHRIPLQIHHIDGNSLNNIEDNLQVLCPNCHSLTENFGSRNKNAPNGKSQYYRRS